MALNQLEQSQVKGLQEFIEERTEWQKPSDWIDIRSGALPDSVYYLVGHSADYSTYPAFDIYAQVSSSGTYDVYVDGVKQASAVASGTTTTLNWQTLALATGWNVTYPSALRTHIVRIVPTVSTNKFIRIGNASLTRSGMLWMHSTLSYSIDLRTAANVCENLEALTTYSNGVMKVSNLYQAFQNSTSLVEIPAFDGGGESVSLYNAFSGCTSLKKISLKDLTSSSGSYIFNNCSNLKTITCDNAILTLANNTFSNCNNLKVLLPIDAAAVTTANSILAGCTSLDNTFLDMQPATGLTRIVIGGTASARIDGLKGLLVSNEAPFSGSSPQIGVQYTGLDHAALVALFNSLPTVTDSQVCNVTGAAGAADLTAADLAIATNKGWTVTR